MHALWNLPTLWFVLIAVLWAGYFFLEGFDFGVGMLMPWLGRSEEQRRLFLRSIGPVWDGNEVWLLVAGGATFAAFPQWYATLFSGFYLPLFLILIALILRIVALELRRRQSARWRPWWDRAIFVGSALPALLWGVAFANFVAGVPIDRQLAFTGNLLDLLHPYALLGGVVTLLLFLLHGSLFSALKIQGPMGRAAGRVAGIGGVAAGVALAAFLAWSWGAGIIGGGTVAAAVLGCLSLVAVAGALLLRTWSGRLPAFLASGLGVVLLTATFFAALYPRVLVSSSNPAWSLTIANSASGHYTLTVMTIVAAIFTPLVLLYQGWTYWVFRARVRARSEGPE